MLATYENSIITKQARDSLRGKWDSAIGVCVVYLVICI